MTVQPSLSHRPGSTPVSPIRRRVIPSLVIAVTGLAACWPLQAAADESAGYPNRPVRLIVSYAPGNVTDTLARLVADGLSAKWGQPVTVDNRPGQGGSLGAQLAAKAPADGYTLVFSAMAAMAVNPALYPNVGYDVKADFAPIVNVAYPDLMMVVSPALKIDSLPKLVEYSKANPTAVNFGTAGNGTLPHLNMEALKQRSGLKAQHVPYKSAGAVLTDVIGGRIQVQQDASSLLMPQVKAGKLVPVAVGGPRRDPQLPDVPRLGELYPGFEPLVPWLGLFAPARTPVAIVDKVNRDVREVLQRPTVREQLGTHGLTVAGGTPQEFASQVQKDVQRLGSLVKQLNIKVD